MIKELVKDSFLYDINETKPTIQLQTNIGAERLIANFRPQMVNIWNNTDQILDIKKDNTEQNVSKQRNVTKIIIKLIKQFWEQMSVTVFYKVEN